MPEILIRSGANAVIDQLTARVFTGHQIKPDIIAGPTFPESVIRIGDDRHERNAIRQAEFLQYARKHVLRERMNAHHHVRTPLLKLTGDVTDCALIKELASIRTKSID